MHGLPGTSEICFPKKICNLLYAWGAEEDLHPAFGHEEIQWESQGKVGSQRWACKQRVDLTAHQTAEPGSSWRLSPPPWKPVSTAVKMANKWYFPKSNLFCPHCSHHLASLNFEHDPQQDRVTLSAWLFQALQFWGPRASGLFCH